MRDFPNHIPPGHCPERQVDPDAFDGCNFHELGLSAWFVKDLTDDRGFNNAAQQQQIVRS